MSLPDHPTQHPRLLLSLHDISPLTLPQSQVAFNKLVSLGIPRDAITLLVIPCHEGVAPLVRDEACASWLRDVAAEGADLVMHGYTHRMAGRSWTPTGLFWAHAFARGQAELYRADAPTAKRSLEAGIGLLERAGLVAATKGFVAPAWLMSRSTREVVRERGFSFYETMAGIIHQGRVRARHLIGWGSLSAAEAWATAGYSVLRAKMSLGDVRVAIHPQDMSRPVCIGAIERVVRGLLPSHVPQSYATYLS